VDEEAYLSYARKKEAARLSNALNRSQILNVSIAEPAPVPITPVRPQPLVNLLLGALIGLSAGVAAAFLREQLDDTIKTAGDVRKGGDLEVLAVIPEG
jgi:capsular polysaccharide biosynthesis protein